ncbi:MAG: hypothetical protein CM15mP105_1740 [Methanobacteriota archaeon]|nr:MAG: hypothetical protein CM15mP105_1740 [Euryarchaeota archaeon]
MIRYHEGGGPPQVLFNSEDSGEGVWEKRPSICMLMLVFLVVVNRLMGMDE